MPRHRNKSMHISLIFWNSIRTYRVLLLHITLTFFLVVTRFRWLVIWYNLLVMASEHAGMALPEPTPICEANRGVSLSIMLSEEYQV